LIPLWVSFALLGAGILAIYLEIFVPAAGLIGLAGGGMIVAGVVLGYAYHDPLTGSIVLFVSLVLTPTAIFLGLKAFPNTPVGKRLILSSDRSAERSADQSAGRGGGGREESDGGEADGGAASGGDGRYADLARGTEGEAVTVLRPSGTGRFGRARVSVVTSGEFIEQGAPIRIVRVEGNRVVVREAPRSES
jgi:membrane-bound serine protease (ClpP class)